MQIPQNLLIYFDTELYHDNSISVIENYTSINSFVMKEKNKILFPIQYVEIVKDNLIDQFSNNLNYHNPYLDKNFVKNRIEEFDVLLSTIIVNKKNIIEGLNIDYVNNISSFIIENNKGKVNYYQYFNEINLSIRDWIFTKFKSPENIYYDIFDGDDSNEYDPDKDETYKTISNEIREKIKLLGNVGAYKLLSESLHDLLKVICATKPEVQANKLLSISSKVNNYSYISALKIDRLFNIYLVDYNNIEVKMPTLSKVVFIFFLNHPEGILFKEIKDYKHEIYQIYYKITNRTDNIKLDKSLQDLLSPTSNSLNEKCSRIKDAFLSVIGDDLAKYYYITGDRGKIKSIKLPRELLLLENY